MTAKILDGKALALRLKGELKAGFAKLAAAGRTGGLVSLAVDPDDGTKSYRKSQAKLAKELEIHYAPVDLPATASKADVLAKIAELNADPIVWGVILQLPLPKHLNAEDLASALAARKNVEGIDAVNLGAIVMKRYLNQPCTARAAVELAAESGIDFAGKHAVVVGRSTIVGKPAALLLLDRSCTVTVCHSKTRDLPAVCRSADILVTAIGTQAGMVKGDWIKPGAVVVDVGIIETDGGKIRGDVDSESAAAVAGWLSPVPGGVGPVTTVMLYKNLLEAAGA